MVIVRDFAEACGVETAFSRYKACTFYYIFTTADAEYQLVYALITRKPRHAPIFDISRCQLSVPSRVGYNTVISRPRELAAISGTSARRKCLLYEHVIIKIVKYADRTLHDRIIDR